MPAKSNDLNEVEAKKKRRRQLIDALTFRVGWKLASFVVAPFAIPVIVLALFILLLDFKVNHTTFLVVVACYAIYLSTILALSSILGLFQRLSEDSIRSIEHKYDEIDKTISDKLSISVDSLTGRGHVSEALAIAYETTFNNRELIRKNPSAFLEISQSKSGDQGKYLVHYFGTANVSPSGDRKAVAAASSENALMPDDRYANAIRLLQENGIAIKRYVRLFEDPSFKRRQPLIREKYLKWIKGQVDLINGNANYVLIDARRAPRFQALRNFVITPDTYIDILGDGDHGYRIKGQSFASDQLGSALSYLIEGDASLRKEYRQSNRNSTLQDHLNQLEALHKERLAEEVEERSQQQK